jgi:sulfur dioxygenase
MAAAGLPHPYFRPPRPGAVPLVAPEELRSLLDGADPPWLLDVREPAERALARLPGDHGIPASDLPRRLGELPGDRVIVAYDRLGFQARRAVALLEGSGFTRVAALEGGLDEYARTIDPTIPRYAEPINTGLVLEQLPRASTGCLAYFLGDPVNHASILIDPGHDVGPYLAELHHGGWSLAAIVETHTHADHLAGHAELAARTGAPIYVSERSPAAYPHKRLEDGEALAVGAFEVTAFATPGHTRDHLTLLAGSRAFTGDTLLLGSCGRTDLGDGDPGLLWESLTERILKFPAETEVFPAHYGRRHALPERYSSTVGFERGTNEALLQGSREAFLKYMTEGWPPKPADFDRIVRENLTH